MVDCAAINCGVGLKVGPGTYVNSRGFRAIGNRIGVKNEGVFDGPDTIIE